MKLISGLESIFLVGIVCCTFGSNIESDNTNSYEGAFTTLTLALDGTPFEDQYLMEAMSIIQKFSVDNNATVAAGAKACLAEVYERGLEGVVERDWAQALELYQNSADAGNALSCHAMAFAHTTGWAGCPVDSQKAEFYSNKAVDQKLIPAMMFKGAKLLLEDSDQMLENCEQSLVLYREAADAMVSFGMVPGPPLVESDRLKNPTDKMDVLSPEEIIKDFENEIRISQKKSKEEQVMLLTTLAQVYEYGLYGVPLDPIKASDLYVSAAEKGSAEAYVKIGMAFLRDGKLQEALTYLQPAAEIGVPEAFFGIGKIVCMGIEGVFEANEDEGIDLIANAAEAGHDEALKFMGDMALGLVGTGEVSDEDAHNGALLYYATAAQKGHALSAYRLAQMIERGQGIERSCVSAALHYKAVCEMSNHAYELKKARKMFANGDEEGALHFYARAAEEGYELGQSSAAWAYSHKKGYKGKDNFSRAARYYEMSAEQGNLESINELAAIYSKGPGDVPVNFTKASVYLSIAAGQGDFDATEQLAAMYEKGLGVERDPKMAASLYKLLLKALPKSGRGPVQVVLKGSQLGLKLANCMLSSITGKNKAKKMADNKEQAGSDNSGKDNLHVPPASNTQPPNPEETQKEVPSGDEDIVDVSESSPESFEQTTSCNVFLFLDIETELCLSPAGFEKCSQQSLWIPFVVDGEQVLVNVFHESSTAKEGGETKCLWAHEDGSLSAGNCEDKRAKGWGYDPEKFMMVYGPATDVCVGRAVEEPQKAQLVPVAGPGSSRLAMYEVGISGVPGIIIQESESLTCFDGTQFIPCSDKDLSLRWGLELMDHRNGGAFAYYKTAMESPGHIQCLHIKQNGLALVDCNMTEGLTLWSFRDNKLQSQDGKSCLGIGSNGRTVLESCDQSAEGASLHLVL